MEVRTPGWRWSVVLALVAVLVSLPSVIAVLPTDDIEIEAADLLERVRGSDDVAWSGYGEARGDLVLPDVRELADLPELISGTTRLRAWWRDRDDFRVDALSLVGERDVVAEPLGTWTWESADRAATLVVGDVDVRLPRGADLLAPALGARLARSDAVTVERLPVRRVAGVDAAGLRLTPTEQATTTVDRVELWAEPRTGLPLRVELYARDVAGAALTSVLLDLELSAPAAELTAFSPPHDTRVDVVQAPDLAAAADRFAPFRLPPSLVGLPRRERVGDIGEGVGTYGEGFTAMTVVPLEGRTADGLLRSLQQPGDRDDEAVFETALLQGLVARDGERAYLLVGTVPQDLLRRALSRLRAVPPPRREQ